LKGTGKEPLFSLHNFHGTWLTRQDALQIKTIFDD